MWCKQDPILSSCIRLQEMVFNSNISHWGYAFLDASFLLRLPISVVAHLETFSGVLFWQKSKPWLCSHISLHSRANSCMLHDAGKDTIWHLVFLAFFQATARGITFTIILSFLSPPAYPFFFFFFLIHVQQVPSVPSHVPRSFPMSAVELKRDFLNVIDQVVTNLAGSHSLDIHQIATTECRCWVSSVF